MTVLDPASAGDYPLRPTVNGPIAVAPGPRACAVGRNVMPAPRLVKQRDNGEAQAQARALLGRVGLAEKFHEMDSADRIFIAPRTPELPQFLSALH